MQLAPVGANAARTESRSAREMKLVTRSFYRLTVWEQPDPTGSGTIAPARLSYVRAKSAGLNGASERPSDLIPQRIACCICGGARFVPVHSERNEVYLSWNGDALPLEEGRSHPFRFRNCSQR